MFAAGAAAPAPTSKQGRKRKKKVLSIDNVFDSYGVCEVSKQVSKKKSRRRPPRDVGVGAVVRPRAVKPPPGPYHHRPKDDVPDRWEPKSRVQLRDQHEI